MELTNELQKLRQSTPDVDLVMSIFEEADRIYTEAQVAMGKQVAGDLSPVASTSVDLTFVPDVSVGEYPVVWQ